ncbi:MAG: SDR family oxidoreductase [Deltaproteobacteria bacterium]|nr:SDR family oxidoreductase [Deltaproteobacteria bacterium]
MGTAVITGAGRGLGRATAIRLAADGHRIVAVDLDGEAAERTAAAVGGEARRCDVADWASVDALAASLESCDVLVNNAGIWHFHSLLETTPESVAAVLGVNVVGVLLCSRALAPKMIAAGGGSIVNLASAAAWTNSPGTGIYPATKAAVISLTKQMAIEWGEHGIRANAVGPGLIVTEGTADRHSGDRSRERSRNIPLRRVGEPRDIADVVSFLASDAARYVTGQTIFVDGGITAGRAAL